MDSTHGLELVELCVRLVGRLVRPCFGKNFLEAHEDLFFMELVAVELEPIDELLDRSFGLEGQQRQAIGYVAPLTWIFRKTETLTELLNNILCLFLL